MTSKTEICNLALLKLGKNRIQNIDTDESQQATTLALVYDIALRELLGETTWDFAVFRQALNKTTETPLYKWAYKFQLPTYPKFIRLVEVNNNPEYELEGEYILTNENELMITYIGEISDASKFSVDFQKTFISLLAYKICFDLTNSNDLEDKFYKQYIANLTNAMNNIGSYKQKKYIENSYWINARTL